MIFVLKVLAVIILIESITNILTKSDIFLPLRKYLFKSSNIIFRFIHDILDCPYCTSVWVSVFCIIMLYLFNLNILPQILTLFFMGLIFHRLSNILHHIIDRIDPMHLSLDKENE